MFLFFWSVWNRFFYVLIFLYVFQLKMRFWHNPFFPFISVFGTNKLGLHIRMFLFIHSFAIACSMKIYTMYKIIFFFYISLREKWRLFGFKSESPLFSFFFFFFKSHMAQINDIWIKIHRALHRRQIQKTVSRTSVLILINVIYSVVASLAWAHFQFLW